MGLSEEFAGEIQQSWHRFLAAHRITSAGSSSVLPLVDRVGVGRRRPGANYYSLFLEKGEPRAEHRTLSGEELVMFWYSDLDDPAKTAVREVLRLEEMDGQVARLRYYTFCPETVFEVSEAFGLPMIGLGYGAWSTEFVSLRKEEEFLKWREQSHPH